MPSNHLILCRPLLLLPSIFPSIRVFSTESVLCIRWPKYWSFSFNISPSNEYSGLISFRMDWLDLLESKGLSRIFSNTTVQKHQFFGPSNQSNPKERQLPKNAQTTAQLHSSDMLVKNCPKFSKPGFNNKWTVNFQMFKLVLEKAEEPEIKLTTSVESSKKQKSSRKTSISALLTMPKPLTV